MTKTLTTELLSVARAMRDYIDALPSDVVASLPTMPGFDRDWADEVIEAANREAQPVAFLSKGDVDTNQPHILARRYQSLACTMPVYTAPPAPAVASGENCWSCGKFFTYAQHSECDGYCPHCDAPVDLNEGEEETAPPAPAPAVPDISALTDLIVDRLIDCSAADDDSIADAETFVYNACRAAMLAAVPDSRDAFESTWADVMNGNKPARSAIEGRDYAGGAAEFAWKWWQRAAMLAQPVSQVGNWVSCSEQMPVDCQTVLCSNLLTELSGIPFIADYVGAFQLYDGTKYEAGFYVNRELQTVTHWMPSPAAPEGGNDA